MSLDPEGMVSFEAGGEKFTAVFGFKAMKAVETHFDLPFFRAIQSAMPSIALADTGDRAKLVEASADIRFDSIGALFTCALLKHHPKLTEAQIEDIVDEIGLSKVSEIIGETLAAALSEGDDDSSAANPPRKSRQRKTG